MVKSGVYQIILKEDGRSYIGSSIDIEARWKRHKESARLYPKTGQVIARAIAKYGADQFNWVVLETCDEEQLLDREQYWLDSVRPFADENNGFNVRKIADSNFGITRTIESRKKQSVTMTGVLKTDKHKQRMKEVWHNNRGPEYYAQLSVRVTGDKNPAKRLDVREKISKSMTGKTWSDDEARVKRHIESHTGKTRSDEAKKNMKAAQQKNKTRSNEAKIKFSMARRKHYQITSPDGTVFELYSKELKQFCLDQKLTYSNLISTAKNGKSYLGGWFAKLIP